MKSRISESNVLRLKPPLFNLFRNSKIIVLLLVVSSTCSVWVAEAQTVPISPPRHYPWSPNSAMPGSIGQDQLSRSVAPQGFFQAFRMTGPAGLQVTLRAANLPPSGTTVDTPADFALVVGSVYRLQLDNIPGFPGSRLFPSVEILDRLHPPQGLQGRYPVPLDFTDDELHAALEGRLITKVIFLEQPDLALPTPLREGEVPVHHVRPGDNVLQLADTLGRPIAIIRMGLWTPMSNDLGNDPLGPNNLIEFPDHPLTRRSVPASFSTVPQPLRPSLLFQNKPSLKAPLSNGTNLFPTRHPEPSTAHLGLPSSGQATSQKSSRRLFTPVVIKTSGPATGVPSQSNAIKNSASKKRNSLFPDSKQASPDDGWVPSKRQPSKKRRKHTLSKTQERWKAQHNPTFNALAHLGS